MPDSSGRQAQVEDLGRHRVVEVPVKFGFERVGDGGGHRQQGPASCTPGKGCDGAGDHWAQHSRERAVGVQHFYAHQHTWNYLSPLLSQPIL